MLEDLLGIRHRDRMRWALKLAETSCETAVQRVCQIVYAFLLSALTLILRFGREVLSQSRCQVGIIAIGCHRSLAFPPLSDDDNLQIAFLAFDIHPDVTRMAMEGQINHAVANSQVLNSNPVQKVG